jgi:iron complex outermembrane receptor protein
LANAQVRLTGIGSTQSDKGGYFKFEGVMYGKYELVISLEGFESITQSIEVYEENLEFTEPIVMQAAGHNLDEVVVTASRLRTH